MLNGFNFHRTVIENIGDYKFILNHKSNISRKNLIVIFYGMRPINLYTIFFKNFSNGLHFGYHVFILWICTSFYMLCTFWVVSVFKFWHGAIAIGPTQYYSTQW